MRAARAAGLVVFVWFKDEEQSGDDKSTVAALPNGATIAIWHKLACIFRDDKRIVCEMYNEPQDPPSDDEWMKWRSAMEPVVSEIRSRDAANVVVADGIGLAETLDGFPPVRDPLGRVVYSSHPYHHSKGDQDQTTWMRKFGAAAATVPVIVGEWTTVANAPNAHCDASTPDAARSILEFMAARNIGLVAVSYDFALPLYGGIVTDLAATPTTFVGEQCRDSDVGPGKLIQRWCATGVVPDALQ